MIHIILIVVLIIFALCQIKDEPFDGCPNCGDLDEDTCGSCLTCGYCVTPKGDGSCVPGDVNGPFFRSDCATWEHPLQEGYYVPGFYGINLGGYSGYYGGYHRRDWTRGHHNHKNFHDNHWKYYKNKPHVTHNVPKSSHKKMEPPKLKPHIKKYN